jgi:hypothetical protein
MPLPRIHPHRAATQLLALLCVGCVFQDPPGQGPKALLGYRTAEPVIAALNVYHTDSGAYPPRLEQLVPQYLAESTLAAPPGWTNVNWPKYSLTSEGYALGFWYSGPGSNTCTYGSATAAWACRGAY